MLTKITLFLGIALSIASFTQAQEYKRPKGSEFSFGIEGALPLHGWKVFDGSKDLNYSKLGGGVTLKYAYNFNETVAATFQTGYIYFPGKTVFLGGGYLGTIKINVGQLPFKAGIRFSMGSFYVEPQLGMSSINSKTTKTLPNADNPDPNQQSMPKSVPQSAPVSTTASSTAFTYAIGVGAMAAKNFDYSIRYETMSKKGSSSYYEAMSKNGTSSYLAIRFSYSIPFSKKQ